MSAANSEETAKTTRGKPFQKGQSGNPRGRPRADPRAREMLKANTLKAVKTIIALLSSESDKVALMAAQTILDRAWGKALQQSEVQMDVSGTLDVTAAIHAELLRQLAEERECGNTRSA